VEFMPWCKKLGERETLMMRLLMFVGLFNVGLAMAAATGWDARTTVTNTAVTGADIQQALNAGLTPAFTQAFPVSNFGLHVQVDRHQMKNLAQDLVYVGLGLSSRLPNGDYRLAEGYLTDIVMLPQGASNAQQRQLVGQRLQGMAGDFSQLMVQHKSGGPASDPAAAPSSPHWSAWPNYQRGAPASR
jgi:hypothetical protein